MTLPTDYATAGAHNETNLAVNALDARVAALETAGGGGGLTSGSFTGDVRSGTLAPAGSVGGAWQTNDCKWAQFGSVVHFRYYMLWGTTGVVNGSGTYAFMLPDLPQFRIDYTPDYDPGFILGPCGFMSAPLSQQFEIDSAQLQFVGPTATPYFTCNVIVGTTRNSVGYAAPFSNWVTARPEFLFTASFLTTATGGA